MEVTSANLPTIGVALMVVVTLVLVMVGWIKAYRLSCQENYLIKKKGKLKRPEFGIAVTAMREEELRKALVLAESPSDKELLQRLLKKRR